MVRLTMKRTLIVFVPILFLFSVAYADIYKYIDENGVVCYTNAPFGKKAEMVVKEKVVLTLSQQQTSRVDSKNTTNYHGIILEKATKYEIDPSLVKAVIKTESNWNERAVSGEGAMGLMQLMPSTANEMDVRNPFNPEENIEGGTRYLRFLLDRFNGDLTLTLAAYNAGPRSVKKLGLVPPITETRQYVDKVLSLYKNGRTTHPSLAIDKLREKRPEPIYKVILEDGTLLFTNSTLLLKDAVRF
ncbi:MAG: lytic transglycosylase domain-containing protein [Thermodesulfovibrionales bacterium]|nr:lytic transglycosylase domain-containing protein [Thermodesulfovibrionales bacterium]